MIIKNTRAILLILCGALMCVSSMVAQENTNHFLRRDLSPAEELEIQEQRMSQIPEDMLNSMALDTVLRAQYYDDSQYLYRIHNDAYYAVVSTTGPGDYVKLNDASVWIVSPKDRYIVKSWAQDQVVFIKPDVSCLSIYRYVLHNRATNQIARVNFADVHNDPMNIESVHVITGIDAIQKIVYLNDGSAWYMNPNNSSFVKWWIGDRVIVGVNNRWRTALYPQTLINVSVTNAPYCEATSVNY